MLSFRGPTPDLTDYTGKSGGLTSIMSCFAILSVVSKFHASIARNNPGLAGDNDPANLSTWSGSRRENLY